MKDNRSDVENENLQEESLDIQKDNVGCENSEQLTYYKSPDVFENFETDENKVKLSQNKDIGNNEQENMELKSTSNDYTELDLKIKAQKRALKVPLVLSMIGMILSLFCGSGLPLSIVGFILAKVKYKKIKSQSLLWARNIGFAGIVMNAIFIIALNIFAVMISLANEQTVVVALSIF